METAEHKHRLRIVRFLAPRPATMGETAAGEKVLLDGGDRGTIAADAETLKAMAREGHVRKAGTSVSLTSSGRAWEKRAARGPAGLQDQHRDLDTTLVDTESGPQVAIVNWAESPLGQLMRRRNKDGSVFLSPAEFQAGERLRADYTRGQIMPRLGANWEASVASGRRDGGIADLTDAALAARQRVEGAIAAVGPELSGVLIDVCCFLKGMETVEMERGWPVRSAKVVLKTALGVLSRHYNPAPAKASRRTLHWGAADYRPSMG